MPWRTDTIIDEETGVARDAIFESPDDACEYAAFMRRTFGLHRGFRAIQRRSDGRHEVQVKA